MSQIQECGDREVWDGFVLDNDGHPLQLWGWGELKASHGWQVDRRFLTDEDGQFLAGAQLLIRRLPWPFGPIVYVPRGPFSRADDSANFLNQLADHVKQKYHPLVLSIEPDTMKFEVPESWRQSSNKILPNETIMLDLEKDQADLLADMSKKTRQYIRKSSADSSLDIRKIRSEEDFKKCLGVYHETSQRANFPIHSDRYYFDVHQKLGENSQILGAYVDNELVAFLWLAISAEVAYELYGGMNEVGRDLRANYALKWQAITKCQEWGISRYDFGGLIEGGVSNFKLGWSSQPIKMAGTFDLPLSWLYGVWYRILPIVKKINRLKPTRH